MSNGPSHRGRRLGWGLVALTLLAFGPLAYSAEYGKLYWSDSGTGKIERANLDLTGRQTVSSDQFNPFNLDVDFTHQQLYWSIQGLERGILRSNLDGSDRQLVTTTGNQNVYGLAVDEQAGQIYWCGLRSLNRTSFDGLRTDALMRFEATDVRDVKLDPIHHKLYWPERDGARIMRCNLNGTSLETVLTTTHPESMTLDPAAGKMYWADYDESFAYLRRSNLDGTNTETLANVGTSSSSYITSIDADPVGGKLYWTDMGVKKIGRANLDGSQVEYIVTTGLQSPGSVAVLPAPEPATALLLVLGAGLLRGRRRTR